MLILFYFRCRPPWRDPRFGFGFIDNNGSSYSLDTVETAVSPGLRLKYTNRSGESLAYQVSKFSIPNIRLAVLRKCIYVFMYVNCM